MTDEARLHKMMANPGPPPDDDTAGWPFKVGDRVLNRATGQAGTVVGPGVRVAVQYSDDPGVVGAGAEWENPADLTLLTDQRLANPGPAPNCDADGRPLLPWVDMTERPAGLSSASTSGTGGPTFHLPSADGVPQAGLVDTVDSLLLYTQSAARRVTAIAEELEGRCRELWDAVITTAWDAANDNSAGDYASGLEYAFHLLTGIDSVEVHRRLAAELDSRYGTDRAKGGGPS